MTRTLLYLIEEEAIAHSYLYIGSNRILCKYLDSNIVPPIEVIVKRCFIGTDKHRYHDLKSKCIRKNKVTNENKDNKFIISNKYDEYPDIVVRFDYRNPNHVDGKPKGDECLYEDLADYFIDTKQARQLARYTFLTISYHLNNVGVYFQDVCFIITSDGLLHFYEISQDCGRYKKINEDGMGDLDKDIWRSGGSSELVLLKWKEMNIILNNYMRERAFK